MKKGQFDDSHISVQSDGHDVTARRSTAGTVVRPDLTRLAPVVSTSLPHLTLPLTRPVPALAALYCL